MATRTELVVDSLASLAWAGDDLVDWVAGKRIRLDGRVDEFGTGYSYKFDSAVGLGDVGVRFELRGTKGQIVRWNGRLPEGNWVPLGVDWVREIDRSMYHATDYAYPVCLLVLPDGREAIAHCPKDYDTLELELLDGTPLTRRADKSEDIFHSRLAASPDGRWLLSNGWVWHPWNIACVYDVARALAEPAYLAGSGIRLDLGAFEGEADAAVLVGDKVVVAGSADCPALSVIELPSGKNLACTILDAPLGTRLCTWGFEHVVALDGEARVVAFDGTVVETLPVETHAWHQPSVNLTAPEDFVAIDPRGGRFAIGTPAGRIVVIARAAT